MSNTKDQTKKDNANNIKDTSDNNQTEDNDHIEESVSNKEVSDQNMKHNENDQQTTHEAYTNPIESLKGRIIATAKLLKFAEASRTEIETERTRVDGFKKQIEQLKTKNGSLEEKLNTEKTRNNQLREKLDQLEKSGNNIATIQTELKAIIDQKANVEKHLSGREVYISQLEASIKNLEKDVESLNKRKEDKKDKVVKDLQNQLKSLQKKYESAEEDKMETSIHYEMLQRDHDEIKQQLNDLKNSQKINNDNKGSALVVTTAKTNNHLQTHNSKINETQLMDDNMHNELNKKLQDSHRRIEALNMELQRFSNLKQPIQPSKGQFVTEQKYNGLLEAFKKCLADMELMKKEKRVLQDKLTEQLVLNADLHNEKQKSNLAQYGIYPSHYSIDDTITNIQAITSGNDFENDDEFEEIDNTIDEPSQPQPSSSSLGTKSKQLHPQSMSKISSNSTNTKKIENTTRSIYGTNGLVIPESQVHQSTSSSVLSSTTRKPKLTKLEKLVGVRRPATLGTAPTTLTKRKSDLVIPPRKKIIISESSSTSSTESSSSDSSPSPKSTSLFSDYEEEEDMEEINEEKEEVRKLSSVASTKHTTENLLQSPSVKTPSENILNSMESSKIGESSAEFIIERIKHVSRYIPSKSINYLNDMETYLGSNIHLLLLSLESFYKSLKSSTNPLTKFKFRHTMFDRSSLFGVPDQLEIECPQFIDVSEKHTVWYIWALISLYPEHDPYTKIVEWAYDRALTTTRQNKLGISCRYIRLLTLLCRNANDKQRISTFCFDFVRSSPRNGNLLHPMLNITVIWPEILDLGENGGNSPAGTHMIIKAIQRSCVHFLQSEYNTDENNKCDEINKYMVDLVHWPTLSESQSLQEYIQELKTVLTLPDIKLLHSANKNAFDDFCINLIKAVEISAWRLNDWNWIYNDLIIKDLWHLMKDDVLSNTSLFLMGLLVRCYLPSEQGEEEESEGLKYLRSTFNAIISVGNDCVNDEFPLQITAVRCILMVANYNMEHILPVIKWYDKLSPSLTEKLTDDIHESIQKLKSL
ncbi:unnamed protein product [Cunninghamella blakesleeana]